MGKYRCEACGVEFELWLSKQSQSEGIMEPMTFRCCDREMRFLRDEEEDG